MKYIKPTDFLSVREFKAEYERISQGITELLAQDASARTADELNQRLKSALDGAVKYLSSVNSRFAKTELSKAFNEGKANAAKEDDAARPKMTIEQANAILTAQGYKYSKDAFSKDLYIELQTATVSAVNGLKTRVNATIEQLRKEGNDSVYNVQQAIIADLQERNVFEVEYANGAKQTLDVYAAMAARSARIESANIGAIGRALQGGTDLVIMTSMPQCCKYCGAYQDKVYSISGKDKRFPALFKTVLRSGYALPHPNCRHEFLPYYAEAEDPADVERMAKQSRIKYDSKGNLVDVRSQKDIELYQMWQAGNRERNAELREFERMKAYYDAKGIAAPYATLAAFRRARRAQSANYRESRKEWAQRPKENRQTPLTNAKNSAILQETIPLPDEQLPRSLGAKWMNYDILMPDGTIGRFLEGSKLHHKEVFAGKGCKRKIDQIDMLVSNFGGAKSEWQKVKAIGKVVGVDGDVQDEEVHWYQEPTVGWVLLKVKVK